MQEKSEFKRDELPVFEAVVGQYDVDARDDDDLGGDAEEVTVPLTVSVTLMALYLGMRDFGFLQTGKRCSDRRLEIQFIHFAISVIFPYVRT